MKKYNLKNIILLSIIFILSCISFTYAWIFWSFNLNTDISGSIFTGYFYSGSGELDDPYIITRPVHFINMTRLIQYDKSFGNKYYKIGFDLDSDGEDEVFEYDDNGTLTGNYSTELNMAAYKTIPIGDEFHPFTGSFDGSNLTVKNLTVESLQTKDNGIFGYVTDTSSIHNVYFDGVSIQASVDNATAELDHLDHESGYSGFIAGHVASSKSFENVFINNCSLVTTTAATSNANNWGYFGFCENAAPLDEFLARAKGTDLGFGGSVDMESLYNRIESLETRSSRVSIADTVTNSFYNGELDHTNSTNSSIEYFYDDRIGSFVWYPYSATSFNSNYNYLGGGIEINDEYYDVTYTEKSGYLINTGTRYLSFEDTNLISSTRDQSELWNISGTIKNNSQIYIYTNINNRDYYLRYNRGLSLSTTSSAWTLTTSGNGFTLKNGSNFLRYTYSWTTTTQTRNASVFNFEFTTIQQPNLTLTDEARSLSYDSDYVTYFPLLVNDDFSASSLNTGYIVSGSNYRSATYPVKSGDIRVSKYSTSDISNSYSTRNKSLTNIYTINSSNRATTINKDNYKRYSDAETDFLSMISSGDIYGLHFMNSLIDMNNLVSLKHAYIANNEYLNYKMPADSIDFNLIEKGYITFFAGTYFSGNNSFFSLHNIKRDQNNEIVSILEIEEIYGTSDYRDKYIYKYSDGTFSENLTSEYSLIFKTSQIKKQQSLVEDAVYYFEIPVNEGEYALGSVDGGTGAYLMYLDIGTNGGENIKSTVDDFGSIEYRSYPDISLNSICLITYDQLAQSIIETNVKFENNTYIINMSSSKEIEVRITLLNKDYKIIFNGNEINSVEIKKFIV